jgi:Flp pilus assembly pilin Flp
MRTLWTEFMRRAEGQDMVEYALLAGVISIASLAGVVALGGAVNDTFQLIADQLAQP